MKRKRSDVMDNIYNYEFEEWLQKKYIYLNII